MTTTWTRTKTTTRTKRADLMVALDAACIAVELLPEHNDNTDAENDAACPPYAVARAAYERGNGNGPKITNKLMRAAYENLAARLEFAAPTINGGSLACNAHVAGEATHDETEEELEAMAAAEGTCDNVCNPGAPAPQAPDDLSNGAPVPQAIGGLPGSDWDGDHADGPAAGSEVDSFLGGLSGAPKSKAASAKRSRVSLGISGSLECYGTTRDGDEVAVTVFEDGSANFGGTDYTSIRAACIAAGLGRESAAKAGRYSCSPFSALSFRGLDGAVAKLATLREGYVARAPRAGGKTPAARLDALDVKIAKLEGQLAAARTLRPSLLAEIEAALPEAVGA